MLNIAVAGATGTVGKYVTALAKEAGFNVTSISRSKGVDLLKPETIDLSGIDVVIDVTSGGDSSEESQINFFETVTKNLDRAEVEAGVAHHIVLSIVGIDRVPHGHYAAKLAQERAAKNMQTPHSILRATQFFEFAAGAVERTRAGDTATLTQMRSQPLAAREVAKKLVELAEEVPSGRVTDIAGPQVEDMADLARRLFLARGEKITINEVELPGPFAEGIRSGKILPDEDAWLSQTTFDDWLKTRDALG